VGHDHDHADDHEHGAHEHAHDAREHAHDHADLRNTPTKRLAFALALTAGFMVVEVVVGVLARSLALVSDAVHMLTDAAALALALWAQRVARRPRTGRRTYGYRRAETLAACANGVALLASTVWVVIEAIRRWSHPPEVLGRWMIVTAALGLIVNLTAAAVLSGGASGHNVNTRAALAHVLADAVGSVAALLAGALVLGLGWNRADPVLSLVISVLILWGAWKLIRDALDVLMEGTPVDLDAAKLEATIRETPGVAEVHDLHAWTVADGFPVVTVHVVLDGAQHGVEVARDVSARVTKAFGVQHVTVQPEAPKDATELPVHRPSRPSTHSGRS
jgi:cobalt-zinc-cadmium efflux system protein